MFEVSLNKKEIMWKLTEEIQSQIIFFGKNVYISKEYITNSLGINVFNNNLLVYNASEIKFKSKYYINVNDIDNYDDLKELFYVKIFLDSANFKKNIKYFINDELYEILRESRLYDNSDKTSDYNLFISIALAKTENEYGDSIYKIGDGKFSVSKSLMLKILNRMGVLNNDVDYIVSKIKQDFNYLIQRNIGKVIEIVKDDEKSLKVCRDIVLFEELKKMNNSIFEKFIIYHNFKLHTSYLDNADSIFFTNNFESFKNKYHEFKKKDLHAFIHGNFKNENAKKVLDKNTYQRLRELYSSGKKFSFRYIARDINATRILEGKPSISKSTLINILKNDSTYMAMHLQRYGKEELNKFLPHPRRLSPLNSMSVVQMDGARINILTKDQGKLVFKYLIVAIDVSSSKVLAYRIVDVENFEAYFFIIQEIIERNLVLPQEIVLDNLTSLTSEKSLAFFDKMKTIGVNVRFHKKHNPQDKSQVENWFRIFNMNYLKDTYGFLGAGIKSKSKDSRPKDELTFEYRKPKNATSYEDLCKIIQSKIDKYNEEYIIPHTNTNPNLRFIDNKPENITKSEFITINRYLFYVESRIILNKSYISVTINGKIHEYMFYDNNYNFLKKYFNKYIIIRYNKQEPKYLYLYENKAIIKHTLKLNLYEKIPMAAHEMSKNQIVISKIHNYRLKKLKNNISNDLLDLRNNILEFDKIKKVKNIEDNIKLKVIPVDLINEKFDSKELINISLEEEYNRVEEDTLDILLNLKSLFKMKGSNDIIN